LRYFALGGTDHHTHAWQGEMIGDTSAGATPAPSPRQLRPELGHPHLDSYQINVA
jgi:hypothetical protein